MSTCADERPHAARAWATERDWVAHREIITELYEGRNLTLRQVMQESQSTTRPGTRRLQPYDDDHVHLRESRGH